MFDKGQLGWVLRNRRYAERVQSIGLVARTLVDRTCNTGARPDEKVCRLVMTTGDDEFRAHCILGRVEHGVLMIAVDDVRRVYSFRLRWEALFVQRIREEYPASGVQAVRFVDGYGGNLQPESNRARRPERPERESVAEPRARN